MSVLMHHTYGSTLHMFYCNVIQIFVDKICYNAFTYLIHYQINFSMYQIR